jgi:hypothetical protein
MLVPGPSLCPDNLDAEQMTGKGIKPRPGKGANPAGKPVAGPAPVKANGANRGTAAVGKSPGKSGAPRQRQIPDAVANRMARRIAIGTGIPTVMGMGVFIASYLLVSRSILDIPPALTLLSSGACFLLGVLGLSYGVLSASWEDAPGTLLGLEQIGKNIERLRQSIRSMRSGNPNS